MGNQCSHSLFSHRSLSLSWLQMEADLPEVRSREHQVPRYQPTNITAAEQKFHQTNHIHI